MNEDIELPVEFWPGSGVWVSPEDAQQLLKDEMLYGNCYVVRISPEKADGVLTTHARYPPHEAMPMS